MSTSEVWWVFLDRLQCQKLWCESVKHLKKNKISIRRPAKTSTERSREFRERKKALKNAASQELNISSSIITETTPKTPAKRSRDYRARKRQKSEENQESNDLTRITVEVEVHQEQDNSQPSTSTLPIKRKKTSTERVQDISEHIPIEESLTAQQHTLSWDEEQYLCIAPGEQNVPRSLLFDEHAEELSFPSIYLGEFRRFSE
ncbi:ATP-dependent DNA helicase [Trichonephila clavipes]|nr:ATP-dependent DNA helicase [Trichonephila clavipes]